MSKQYISARGRAIIVSVSLHLVLFAVLGAVEFSKPSAARTSGTVTAAQISRVLAAPSVVPKPKVRSREIVHTGSATISDIQFDTSDIEDISLTTADELAHSNTEAFIMPETVTPGYVTEFFGSSTQSRKIVYVVDVSGSMHGMLSDVRLNLRSSIDSLKADNFFYILFFGGDKILESGNGKLVRATSTAKRNAFTLIDSVKAGGSTNADQAISRALQVIGTSRQSNGQIYFLSDGFDLQQGQSDKFCNSVENLRKSLAPSARISTIGFWMDDDDKKILARLAKQSNGEFVHIQ